MDAIEASGLTPLDYLLTVMRDVKNDQSARLDAAKAAAQYVHPRLSAVDATHRGDKNAPIVISSTDAEL